MKCWGVIWIVVIIALIAGFFAFNGVERIRGLFNQSPSDSATIVGLDPTPEPEPDFGPEPEPEPQPEPYPEEFWLQWGTPTDPDDDRFTAWYDEQGLTASSYPRDAIVVVDRDGTTVLADMELAVEAKRTALHPFPGNAALVQFANNQMFGGELYESSAWMIFQGEDGQMYLGATGRNMFLGWEEGGFPGILPVTVSDRTAVYTATMGEVRELAPGIEFYNSALPNGRIRGNISGGIGDAVAVIVWEDLDTGEILLVLKIYCGNTISKGPIRPVPDRPDPEEKPTPPPPPEPRTVNVSVLKVWEDSNNSSGLRPSSVTIDLLRGNSVVETIWLNASNNWRYSWTGLRDGTYSVREQAMAHYTASYSNSGGTWTVTNTFEPPPEPDPDPEPEPDPEPDPTPTPTPQPKDPSKDPATNGNAGEGGGRNDEDGPGSYEPVRPQLPPPVYEPPAPPAPPDPPPQYYPGGTGDSIPVQPPQPDLGNTGGNESGAFDRNTGSSTNTSSGNTAGSSGGDSGSNANVETANTGDSTSNANIETANTGEGGGMNEDGGLGSAEEGPPPWQD